MVNAFDRPAILNVSDMLENFLSQARNADRRILTSVDRHDDYGAVVRLRLGAKVKEVLLQTGGNILRPNAAGWMCSPSYFYLLQDPLGVQGVQVSYGYSQALGAVAECSGNKNMDDYRRFAYANNIERKEDSPSPFVFREILTLLTEANLLAFMFGLRLTDRRIR